MTSPTQLKYLEAMGIPVWVSRELVSFDNNVENFKNENVLENTQIEQQTNNNSQNNLNKDHSSALEILDSLNNSEEASTVSTNLERSVTFKNNVADSVSKTQFLPETSTDKSTVAPKIESSSENLIFKTSQHYAFASGDESADWIIIGHSPEPFNGIGHEPFAGEAGELLNNMMTAVGFDNPRHQTYRVNIQDINQVSDTSSNDDLKKELNQKLISIIHKIKPKLVLLVGQIAAQNLLNSEDPLNCFTFKGLSAN